VFQEVPADRRTEVVWPMQHASRLATDVQISADPWSGF